MTDYSDIEQVNRLVAEQADIQRALDMLDDEGTIASVVVSPTEASSNTMMTSAVSVAMTDAPQSMLSGVKAGLTQRYNEINQELRVLGVTGTPPNATGGP
jgi:hypothetical protein